MSRGPLTTLALAIGVALLAVALVVAIRGAPGPVVGWLGGIGALTIIGTLFERVRYKALGTTPPGAGWIATDERFRDPATERWVQVYYRRDTGERRYVESDPPTR